MSRGYHLEKCKKCGKTRVVVEEDNIKEPKEFTQKIDESCVCDEPLKAKGLKDE